MNFLNPNKQKKIYVDYSKPEMCKYCVQFDGEKVCKKYNMITEPGQICKSFKRKNEHLK